MKHISRHHIFSSACLLLVVASAGTLNATVTVKLTSSVRSPQPVGTVFPLTARGTDTNAGPLTYKFEVAANGSSTYTMLQDFNLTSTFAWANTIAEGRYTLRVTARDYKTGESAVASKTLTTTAIATGTLPVVSKTANTLVALFSAPPCPAGSLLRVRFEEVGSPAINHTDFRPCLATTMNLLIGGMLANTTYQMNFQLQTGSTIINDPNVVSFQTGAVPAHVKLPVPTFPVPVGPGTSTAEGIFLAGLGENAYAFASDLSGNTLWYYDNTSVDQLTRPVPGGTIMLLINGVGTGTGYWGNVQKQQTVREIDLAGNTLRETCADRVSEQLPTSDIPYGLDRFSHEARKLPNGNYLVLGETQKIYPPGTQGSVGQLDVIGAVILILDPNLQVVWYWNSFDHAGGGTQLDINRPPVRGETCLIIQGKVSAGCPPALLSSPASEWLHTNALQLVSDGSILMSMRDQDWIAKVDYGNGTGTGNLLWKMGVGGDFTFLNPGNAYPWFSGQHEPAFEYGASTVMSVFDDGDTRIPIQGGNSRGQVLQVDETNKTVSYILNADLGVYSYALGSAQPLSNGDWSFDAGEIEPDKAHSQTIEVNTLGAQTFNLGLNTDAYRTFRLLDFYNVPLT